jgi:hypothetical protein
MKSRLLLSLGVVFAISLAASPSFGKGGGGGGGGGGSRNNGNGGGQNYPPPVDHSASTKARKEVEAAAADLRKANADVAAIVAKLHKEYETSPDAAGAVAALKAAQAELEATRAPVLKNVRDSAAYKSALAAKESAQADRDTVLADPSTSPEDRTHAATAVMEAGKAVTKLETDAVAANPKIAAAQSKLVAANTAWSALLKKFDETLKDNPDWQAAMKVVDDKKQVLASAQKTLSDAVAQEAQAERNRQNQIAQNNRG